MKLKLNLSDIHVLFQISGWSVNDIDVAWGDWCNVELSLHGENTEYSIDYSINDECITNQETRQLCNALGNLLDRKLEKEMHLLFVEPDLEFILCPEMKITTQKAETIQKLNAKLIINLCCSCGLGGNSLYLGLLERDLRALHSYLLIITEQIDMRDDKVKKLLEDGMLILE